MCPGQQRVTHAYTNLAGLPGGLRKFYVCSCWCVAVFLLSILAPPFPGHPWGFSLESGAQSSLRQPFCIFISSSGDSGTPASSLCHEFWNNNNNRNRVSWVLISGNWKSREAQKNFSFLESSDDHKSQRILRSNIDSNLIFESPEG